MACTAAQGNVKQTEIPEEARQPVSDNADKAEDNSESEMEQISETSEESGIAFDFEKKTVRLNSGYDMPIVGLGTYALSDEECVASVTALLENVS